MTFASCTKITDQEKKDTIPLLCMYAMLSLDFNKSDYENYVFLVVYFRSVMLIR